jgi:antitoxin YefM
MYIFQDNLLYNILGGIMTRPFLDEDIKPLSEFRANTTAFIEQVKDSKRPLIITQHGRGAAVLLGVKEYERLLAKLELLQDIQRAETEISEGKGVDHKTARKRAFERLK